MKVKEFINMSIDTRVTVRDNTTKKWIKESKDYNDMEVVSFYGKAHRFGNPGVMRAEIVVFAR